MEEDHLEVPPFGAAVATGAAAVNPSVEVASQPFVGRWNRLVSTTNWEKGRIISEWRSALLEAGAEAAEYADETWAQLVGGVTGQHAGRLRRVHQRFGRTHDEYASLYWSHFQAALDWDDAELWLEGATQSDWSVSVMRCKRWEAMGALAADRPRDGDVVAAETDEDFDPRLGAEDRPRRSADEPSEAAGPRPDGPDFGEEHGASGPARGAEAAGALGDDRAGATVPLTRPFENLPELPADLTDAFEAFKLAILRHRADHWRQISCEDILASLDALKALALAPSAD